MPNRISHRKQTNPGIEHIGDKTGAQTMAGEYCWVFTRPFRG
jgi:hypothetical protein